jgi:hypothetical protein
MGGKYFCPACGHLVYSTFGARCARCEKRPLEKRRPATPSTSTLTRLRGACRSFRSVIMQGQQETAPNSYLDRLLRKADVCAHSLAVACTDVIETTKKERRGKT